MTSQQRIAYRRLYKNHGSSIGYWEGWVEQTSGTNTADIILQYARTMDGKVTRRIHPAKGKNIGRSNETTPLEQAQLELDSRSNKQLDKGYVERQEDAARPSTNTLGLAKPMLATPFDKVKPEAIDWGAAYCQPKLDGHRMLFKNGVLYSRQGKVLDLPHIAKAITSSGAEHLHLDGELYLHGKTLQEISSLVKRHQPGTEDIQYHVYDCVMPANFANRQDALKEALMGGFVHKSVLMVPTYRVDSVDELMTRHGYHREKGYEGTMLRFGNDPYQDGKRSRSLLKLKEWFDAEFTIVGVERGVPNATASGVFEVPVWVCDAGNGKTFTCTAQGNMHEKHALWQEKDKHIGRQLTVKYHYLSAAGVPQLPVALRFREEL